MTPEIAQTTWTELRHPGTGQNLGQARAHYAGPGERLAIEAEKRGIPLPSHLTPKEIRKTILKQHKTDETLGRQVAAHVGEYVADEELKEMRRDARGGAREACSYYDVTISVSKDASLLQVAFESAEDFDSADKIDAALRKAAEAELAVLSEYVGSRMGRNGVRVIDAPRLSAALYVHHLSRDGDPQLHGTWPCSTRSFATTESGGR
jgi:hypothetical protein